MFEIAIWALVVLVTLASVVWSVRAYYTSGPDGGRDPGLTQEQVHAMRMEKHHARRDAKRAAKAARRAEQHADGRG